GCAEIGGLLATGWSPSKVRRLLLAEGLALALIGGLLGLVGASFYGAQMLALLRRNWPGGEGLAFLQFHAAPSSFAIGYLLSLAASFLTILWATRILTKMSPRSLLTGENAETVVASSP